MVAQLLLIPGPLYWQGQQYVFLKNPINLSINKYIEIHLNMCAYKYRDLFHLVYVVFYFFKDFLFFMTLFVFFLLPLC